MPKRCSSKAPQRVACVCAHTVNTSEVNFAFIFQSSKEHLMEVPTLDTNAAAKVSPLGGRASEAGMGAYGTVDKTASLGNQAINRTEDSAKPAERWIHE